MCVKCLISCLTEHTWQLNGEEKRGADRFPGDWKNWRKVSPENMRFNQYHYLLIFPSVEWCTHKEILIEKNCKNTQDPALWFFKPGHASNYSQCYLFSSDIRKYSIVIFQYFICFQSFHRGRVNRAGINKHQLLNRVDSGAGDGSVQRPAFWVLRESDNLKVRTRGF